VSQQEPICGSDSSGNHILSCNPAEAHASVVASGDDTGQVMTISTLISGWLVSTLRSAGQRIGSMACPAAGMRILLAGFSRRSLG
jgi:hypothetical protein